VAWNLKTPLIIWPSWQPLYLLYISVTKLDVDTPVGVVGIVFSQIMFESETFNRLFVFEADVRVILCLVCVLLGLTLKDFCILPPCSL